MSLSSVLHCLGKYLTPDQFVILSQIYPDQHQQIYHAFHQKVIDIIQTRLSEIFHPHWSKIRRQLADGQIHLSGSFILQAILNTTWELSDLDFYHLGDHQTQLESFLDQKLKKYIHRDYPTWQTKVKLDHPSEINSSYLLEVLEYHTPPASRCLIEEFGDPTIFLMDRKIQIIKVNSDNYSNIPESIISEFDFQVCQNWFWYDSQERPQLKIQHLNQILQRVTKYQIKPNSNLKKTKHRFEKYLARGFKFQHPSRNGLVDQDQHIDIILANHLGFQLHYLELPKNIIALETIRYSDLPPTGFFNLPSTGQHINKRITPIMIEKKKVVTKFLLEFPLESPITEKILPIVNPRYIVTDNLVNNFYFHVTDVRVTHHQLKLTIVTHWFNQDIRSPNHLIDQIRIELFPRPKLEASPFTTNGQLELGRHLRWGSYIFQLKPCLQTWLYRTFERYNQKHSEYVVQNN